MSRLDDMVERRLVETVFIVFHPVSGLLTTEMYEERAHERAKALMDASDGSLCYIFQTDKITRIDSEGKMKRIYKVERDRLEIRQEML